MSERPSEARSDAPSTAMERGLTSASSGIERSPAEKERDEDPQEDGAREEGRDDGDDGVGFEPDALEHLLRQGRGVAARDEEGDDGLVERLQKGEEGAHHDARPEHRQRNP